MRDPVLITASAESAALTPSARCSRPVDSRQQPSATSAESERNELAWLPLTNVPKNPDPGMSLTR